jgi:hypothetical protein
MSFTMNKNGNQHEIISLSQHHQTGYKLFISLHNCIQNCKCYAYSRDRYFLYQYAVEQNFQSLLRLRKKDETTNASTLPWRMI